jgi:Amt family ammonium transporter
MHYIPGLRIRVHEDIEVLGIDVCEISEPPYNYVCLKTELKPSSSDPVADNMEPDRREENS